MKVGEVLLEKHPCVGVRCPGPKIWHPPLRYVQGAAFVHQR